MGLGEGRFVFCDVGSGCEWWYVYGVVVPKIANGYSVFGVLCACVVYWFFFLLDCACLIYSERLEVRDC